MLKSRDDLQPNLDRCRRVFEICGIIVGQILVGVLEIGLAEDGA